MAKYIGIVAVCENGGIGKDNKLLVHIKKDLMRFKELTWGKTVVYGRNTLYSFPKQKTLPGRTNLVLSHSLEAYEGALIIHSLDELKRYAKNEKCEEIWVLGGASVYAQMMDFMDELYLTRVAVLCDSDAFFPTLDKSWKCVEKSGYDEENGMVFRFERWVRS